MKHFLPSRVYEMKPDKTKRGAAFIGGFFRSGKPRMGYCGYCPETYGGSRARAQDYHGKNGPCGRYSALLSTRKDT